ncbi:MAG TPA: hypothetical protein H9881_09330 [Candidatus Stackebrandtia excrementipullorum]|nr:hypothetical protein [Candidatus Stackebrandtia excrementipullorum]
MPNSHSYVMPDEVAGRGNDITTTGDAIAETVTNARALGVNIPGLATSGAFAQFRDRMASNVTGPQERIRTAGTSVVRSDHDHLANDGETARPFDKAIN